VCALCCNFCVYYFSFIHSRFFLFLYSFTDHSHRVVENHLK
jgi:hypothetical protein